MAHTTYTIFNMFNSSDAWTKKTNKQKSRQENLLKRINYIMLLISSCCHQVSMDKNNFLTKCILIKQNICLCRHNGKQMYFYKFF